MLQTKVRAGELDRDLSFLRYPVSVGAANSDYRGVLQPIPANPTVKAKKTELPGREIEIAGRLTFVQKTVFTIYYRTDILITDIAMEDGKKYQIISMTETDGRKRFLDVVCNLMDSE